MKTFFVAFISFFLVFIDLLSQPLTPAEDSIPMRDGKYLAADIYIPAGNIPRPTILIQTPYNKYWYRYNLPLNTGTNIDSSSYNFVIVDWRCFYGSSSACISSPNRGEDGYDIIDWIKNQTWSDGKIGTWGPSALGKVQYQTAREKHPNHICAVPLVAGPQFEYLEYFHGGVYRKAYVEQLDALGYGMSTFLLNNPFYNTTWQWVENANWYPADIEIPFFMIGGWYDHNTDLMLDFFNAIQQLSPASSQHKLLMGPWVHGGTGAADVGSAQQGELYYYEAENKDDSLAIMFFNYYLLNENNGWDTNPPLMYFQMGENTWQSTQSWPPNTTNNYKLYLHQGGILDINIPQTQGLSSVFDYDPRNPSPTIGGSTLNQNLLQGPYNQTDSVESRNDILIFTTDVLSQDIQLKGKPVAHLFVSSNRPDTDFAIRLTDVYPDGRSMILCETIRRMRFRNGYATTDTASMTQGQIYEIVIDLKNLGITFPAGHRIRIDITSSNYPRFDNNLNNGGDMYVAGDTLVATNTVYHNSNFASYIEFPFTDYPLSIISSHKSPDFNIYPNPGSEKICISPNKLKKVEIINVEGVKVLCFDNIVDKNCFNTGTLTKGIYIINITTPDNETITKKIIIE